MSNSKSPLNFSNVDVFFNYIFDIGKPIDPIDASRKLLESGLGQAFRNYQTGKSEISKSYATVLNEYKKVITMREALEEIETKPSIKSYIKLIKQEPFHFIKAFMNWLWKSLKGTPNPSEEEISKSDLEKHLEEFDEWAGETVTDLLGLLALHEFVDKEIFSSSYLENVPFARVSLQPFGATVEKKSLLFDVTLTIHRTGIAILSIYNTLSGTLSLEDLQKYQGFNDFHIQDCELPTEVVNRYVNLFEGYIPKLGYSKKFVGDEFGYTKIEKGEIRELGEIFDAYRFYCIEIILEKVHWSVNSLLDNLRSPFWFGYPIIFINKTEPDYSSRERILKLHSVDIARLVLGVRSNSNLKAEVVSRICFSDLSIVEDYSLYLTEECGTVIYYNRPEKDTQLEHQGVEKIQKQFYSSAVLDMLLFQTGIMQIFNSQISHANYDLLKLTKIKQEFISVLQEFEVLGISYYGTVHEIIKRGQEIFRINDLRKIFEIRLQDIENLIQREEERSRLKRERIFKVLTTLVAIVFSLPGIQSVIDVIVKWPPNAPISYPLFIQNLYKMIVRIISQYPTTSTIILYFITVILTLIALWFGRIKLKSKKSVLTTRSVSSSSEHLTSPFEFNVVKEDDDNYN
jgi:hypothetical protein